MTDERWNLLMENDSEKLAPDEISQGWHFCCDWDGLLIGPGMGELESCGCFKCHKCGKVLDVGHWDGSADVCEDCCDDHNYKYDRDERGHFCVHCFRKAPDDWHDP